MIVLAVLLWIQVALLIALGLATLYMAAKERTQSGRIATITAVVFTFFTAVSVTAALVVGGLA